MKKKQTVDNINLCLELFKILTNKEDYCNYFLNLKEFQFTIIKKDRKTKKVINNSYNLLFSIKEFIISNYDFLEKKDIRALSFKQYSDLLKLTLIIKKGLEKYRKEIIKIRKQKTNYRQSHY